MSNNSEVIMQNLGLCAIFTLTAANLAYQALSNDILYAIPALVVAAGAFKKGYDTYNNWITYKKDKITEIEESKSPPPPSRLDNPSP